MIKCYYFLQYYFLQYYLNKYLKLKYYKYFKICQKIVKYSE